MVTLGNRVVARCRRSGCPSQRKFMGRVTQRRLFHKLRLKLMNGVVNSSRLRFIHIVLQWRFRFSKTRFQRLTLRSGRDG